MSKQYEHIITTFDTLKATLNNIVEGDGLTDEELADLTGDQVETLIKHMNTVCSPDYHKRNKLEEDFKTRFLDLPLLKDSPKLIETILRWGETNKWSNDINKYKSHIIKYLSTTQDTKDTSRIYRSVWLSIVKNMLYLNKENVSTLVKESPVFIEYIISSQIAKYKPNKKDKQAEEQAAKDSDSSDYGTDDDYEYGYDGHRKNINMTHVESFIASLLLCTDKFDNTAQLQKILTLYQQSSHKNLRHFPMKVTRFSGEILAPVIAHYSNPANSISPIVKHRRTVGVVIDNKPYRYHKYEDVFNTKNGNTQLYTTSLAIEFPYMCYVCISHVEMELAGEIRTVSFTEKQDNNNINIRTTVETDYVLHSFHDYKTDRTDETTYTHIVEKPSIIQRIECTNPNKPGVYVSIYFSIMGAFMDIKDIRIYGEAISFV